MSIAHLLKRCVARAAYHGGGVALMRRGDKVDKRRGYHVFCYHRIAPDEGLFPGVPASVFEDHCRLLASHYRVLPFHELVERAQRGEPVGDATSITFDDGYRDNLEVALPILEKHGLPATIFLATSAIGTGSPLWHDRVSYIMRESKQEQLSAVVGGTQATFYLETPAARESALLAAHRLLKTVPEAEKIAAIETLREAGGVPDYGGLARDMIDWDEARAMTKRGITFGGHTVNHPVLTRVTLDDAKREIADGIDRIEAETGEPVRSFAYPNGTADDFNDDIKAFLKDRGLAAAGSRGFEANRPDGDPFDVRRWTPHPYSIPMLALRMAVTARKAS